MAMLARTSCALLTAVALCVSLSRELDLPVHSSVSLVSTTLPLHPPSPLDPLPLLQPARRTTAIVGSWAHSALGGQPLQLLPPTP